MSPDDLAPWPDDEDLIDAATTLDEGRCRVRRWDRVEVVVAPLAVANANTPADLRR